MAKLDLFDNQLQVTAIIFKAFSHPARLAILNLLSKKNNCFSGEIAIMLPLGRTTVNQHLKELKEVGLIASYKKGTKVVYQLNHEQINKVQMNINNFLNAIS